MKMGDETIYRKYQSTKNKNGVKINIDLDFFSVIFVYLGIMI